MAEGEKGRYKRQEIRYKASVGADPWSAQDYCLNHDSQDFHDYRIKKRIYSY